MNLPLCDTPPEAGARADWGLLAAGPGARVRASPVTEHTQTSWTDPLAVSGQRAPFRVLAAGDPVKDATVTVAGRSATTDADGRGTITGATPGRYIARATAPRLSARSPG
jgi:hypothetical protein